MTRTKEEIISEMVDSGLFSDQEIKSAANAKKTYSRGFFKTYEGEAKTLPQKADVVAGTVTDTVLNAIKAPYDLVGEAITAPIEERAYRAPSLFGGNNPADPIATINKLLRAGGGAVYNVLRGTDPMQGARAAYNAPRGLSGPIEDTAMAVLLGKVAPEVLTAPMDAALNAPGEIARTARNVASSVTKKVIRAGLSPTEEAQTILFNRPADVARQTNFSDLADKLAQKTNELRGTVSELDNQAWDTLLKLKAEPQSRLINLLKGVKRDFVGTGKTKIGNADRQAAAQIDDYIERIQNISGEKYNALNPGTEKFLDQPQLKEIIQSVQKDARYDLPESDPVNRAVQAVRAKLDGYLKAENPGYEEAMKPVADATEALKDTAKRFRLEHKTNEGFLPTKSTVDALQRSVKGKSPELQRTLDQLKNTTGIDFGDEALLTSVKQEFTPGVARANSSRRANLGAGLGAGIGTLLSKAVGVPPYAGAAVGGILGDVAGGAADYYGGSTAQKIVDVLSKMNSGVGNVLAAANQKTQGTPLQEVVKRLIAGEPVLAPLIAGNQ